MHRASTAAWHTSRLTKTCIKPDLQNVIIHVLKLKLDVQSISESSRNKTPEPIT